MSYKNKERFTLNFRKNSCISVEEVNNFLVMLNNKKYGFEITPHEILAYFIKNHTLKDIEAIQDASYTVIQKMKIKFEKEQNTKGLEISFDEYYGKKLNL